jgi:predicted helicase
MNQVLIQGYLSQLDRIRIASGSTRETVVREAFKDLLKGWGRQHDLIFIAEHEHITPTKDRCYVDGALLHEIRVPFGYWEAKDTGDKLDEEIEKKKRKGYPQDNIIFEDSRHAVLIQDRQEVMRCEMSDALRFEKLMSLFFRYERKEVAEFREAVEQFKADLPAVLNALRGKIDEAHKSNASYQTAEKKFLKHAQETINPSVGTADVREMLIQHVLTEEIFAKVFDDSDFHTHNNIAKELYTLEGTFFTGGLKKQTLKALEPYYAAIRSSAAQISSHAEKQTFLKVIYENFYKVYNAKAADRLGVVYTPNEIVRFVIQGADWLCRKHFDRGLVDKNVEILDPATGTGTFITELIEHFRGDRTKLLHKYRQELHANEVAILPYYVANLNIESTFAAVTGNYEEFENLCFVDTLDNIAPLGLRAGHQHELFGSFSEENIKRVKRQNARKISVILGNPPYNANQRNENDNNKNREYPKIDDLIKATYIKQSTAQKTKSLDMYVRFFRWASDRLDINGDGIIAFVTNRSFVEKHTLDGFRKTVAKDFNEIYVVDLKGDARTSGDRRKRQGGNIFEDKIRVGVAISFFVRRRGGKGCKVFYEEVADYATADAKTGFIAGKPLWERKFRELQPDNNGNWLHGVSEEFKSLLPVASKKTRRAKNKHQERAIFKVYSLGVSTNRDEYVYDVDRRRLSDKVKYLIGTYDATRAGTEDFPANLKWSRNLKRRFRQGLREAYKPDRVVRASYRPFVSRWLYFSPLFIDELGASTSMFPPGSDNTAICFRDVGSRTEQCVLAVKGVADLHFGAAIDAYQQVPRYVFADGERVDNITDWALNRFAEHYEKGKGRRSRPITKDGIFGYVYAVLHDPLYREQFSQDLLRELPRIPFYPDFWRWAELGQALINLHSGFEHAAEFTLKRVDLKDERARRAGTAVRPILKSNKDEGSITIDTETTLQGVPVTAWGYVLGNRSAIDWVLDQYREKTPRDPVIRERFPAYKFADHKEDVIALLKRVTTVSVETMRIVESMRRLPRESKAT